MNVATLSLLELKSIESRKHARVKVQLPGRFMRADRSEYSCSTLDMSPGGISFSAPVSGEVGERIVVYLSQLGRVEGTVSRQFEGGFALNMKLSPLKRERMADQLTWLANRNALGMPEDRRHERIVPRITRVTVTYIDGLKAGAKLLDVSISGAAMVVERTSPLGSRVVVGTTEGHVVRQFAGGMAVEFDRLLNSEGFDEKVIL